MYIKFLGESGANLRGRLFESGRLFLKSLEKGGANSRQSLIQEGVLLLNSLGKDVTNSKGGTYFKFLRERGC